MRKKNILLLFGGVSAEYEVSCMSAAAVYEGLDKERYDITAAGITKAGEWYIFEGAADAIADGSWVKKAAQLTPCAIVPPSGGRHRGSLALFKENSYQTKDIDLIFPVIHGGFGEDGALQGLSKIAGLPCAGADIISSVLSYDKSAAKAVCARAGIKQAKYIAANRYEFRRGEKEISEIIGRELGYPVFIKPANGGSSVGISKVTDKEGLKDAFSAAFKYDRKAIAEEFINGREIEISALGDTDDLILSDVCGEIVTSAGFYDYEAKYENDSAELIIPALLDEKIISQIKTTARLIWNALGCRGYARIDFFVRDGELIFNELNTIPGFTNISMFSKLFVQSGLPFTELLDKIINLALDHEI